MIKIHDVTQTAPDKYGSELQKSIYAGLRELGIAFLRAQCDPAITIDDCLAIEEALGVPVVKTLFLTNRQQTKFYLLSMPGNKPFVTRDFSKALGVSRVSFASPELLMNMLATPVGAASPLCSLADTSAEVRIIIDSSLRHQKLIACPDGTTTNYLRLSLSAVTDRFIPLTGHTAEFYEI